MSLPKLHPSLPAPVFHQSHAASSVSKSTVLAGVQDAYWSDEDADDEDCPLCLEEMDLSDINFKPCPCGYQICRFCWHHIKENLNGRCPACRRQYTDDSVEFKPVNKEDHKRLTQQKKQRERERKDLDALGRRHLVNVRVVQRNVVYVVGLGSRFAKEELIPTLRSSEYFGQYGRITKILLVKRTPPGGRGPVLGLYITYYRREDAARAIQAVDGSPSPSGGGDVMRASYGTTKYCIAFLRGVSCSNHGCMDLHDWGDQKDCFTKEDLTTLKHTMKDSENRARSNQKSTDESVALPRSAGWGQRTNVTAGNATASTTLTSGPIPVRGTRRGHKTTRSGGATESRTQPQALTKQQERRVATKPASQSLSRPSTPGLSGLPPRPLTPASVSQTGKPPKTLKDQQRPIPPKSPTGSAFESDPGSQDASSSPALSAPTPATPPIAVPTAPPGLPAAPPGLTNAPPPGLPAPSNAPSSSPLTRETSNSYQISTQAQALLDDVMNRRETIVPTAVFSPFPDLDRTLQNLTGGNDGSMGGFNFSLDPKLAVDDDHFEAQLSDLVAGVNLSGGGSFDPFSSETTLAGPPLSGASVMSSHFATGRPPVIERSASGYVGSFNPFGETSELSSFGTPGMGAPSPVQDDDSSRRVSRFGFARERQGSGMVNSSNASSPLISANTSLSSMSFHDSAFPTSAGSSHVPWPFQRQHDLAPPALGMSRSGTPASMRSSPLAPYAHVQQSAPMPMHNSGMVHQPRFQPFDSGNDSNSLKEMLGVGHQQRAGGASDNANTPMSSSSPFQDPAIMSSVPYVTSPVIENHTYYHSPMEAPTFDNFSPFLHNAEALGGPHSLQYQHTLQVSSVPPTATHASFPPGLLPNPMSASPLSHSPQVRNNMDPTVMEPTPPPSFTPLDLVQEPSVEPSPMLSTTDFPALPTTSVLPEFTPEDVITNVREAVAEPMDEKERAKAEKKAAKKMAAAKRVAEREQAAKERQVEKERLAKEKAEEKERQEQKKSEERARHKAEEKEKMAKEKLERERLVKERAEREQTERERLAALKRADAEKTAERAARAKERLAKEQNKKEKSRSESSQNTSSKDKASAAITLVSPTPMLSKMPKKNKPVTKPLKISKDNDSISESQSVAPTSAVTAQPESPQVSPTQVPAVAEVADTQPLPVLAKSAGPTRVRESGLPKTVPKSIKQMLEEISDERGLYFVEDHPFFDMSKVYSSTKAPLDYETMAHALSAFPAGGDAFTDNTSRLNDKTVACFQQLLETLTQTMSDLVQILPQTTWGSIFDVLSQDLKDLKRDFALVSSTSFDGLVHDDLPSDVDEDEDDSDLDEDEHEHAHSDVLAHTPSMDRRAKWMEIQLTKLEELHRDVNAAAVRAILFTSDRGWDAKGVLPHASKSLIRFENLGTVGEDDKLRIMTREELEDKMVVAKEAVVFAETELKEAMQAMRGMKP